MSCPGHNTIAAYIDGAIAAGEAVGLEAHLDTCDECRRHVSSLARSPLSRRLELGSSDAAATDDVDVLVAGARVSRFIVLRRLGRGGMGEVALGYDPELDRRVALKVLRPELWRAAGAAARERLQREAMTMARLAHPNVVTVFRRRHLGRAGLRGDGAGRGLDPARVGRGRATVAGDRGGLRSGGSRAGRRPRRRHRASRLQAGQRAGRRGRARAGHRFRARPPGRRCLERGRGRRRRGRRRGQRGPGRPSPGPSRRRHARIHGARAARGARGR